MPENTRSWSTFLNRCAWGLGTLLVASGLVTWIAANWWHWSAGLRLGLVESAVVVSLLVALRLRNWNNKFHPDLAISVLLSGLAAVGVGGLLALIGQIYQSGADPWQLFALWTVLIAPLVLTIRSVFLSVLGLVLINMSVLLFQDSMAPIGADFWLVSRVATVQLALNAVLWLVCQTLYQARADHWLIVPRLTALAVFVSGMGVLSDYSAGWVAAGFFVWFMVQRLWRYEPFVLFFSLLGCHIAIFLLLAEQVRWSGTLITLMLLVMAFWLFSWRKLLPHLVGPGADKLQFQSPSRLEDAAQQEPGAKPSVHRDLGESWYGRAFKLFFALLLTLLAVAFLAFVLDIQEQGLSTLGCILLLGVSIWVVKSKPGANMDIASAWQVLGIALYSIGAYMNLYPGPDWLAFVVALLASVFLYRLPAQVFVMRLLLAVWGLVSILSLLIIYGQEAFLLRIWHSLEIGYLLLALWLGHMIYRRAWSASMWEPVLWVLLLLGLTSQDMSAYFVLGFGMSSPVLWASLKYLTSILPLAMLLLYWPLHKNSSTGQWIAVGGVLVVCVLWMGYWPVIAAATCLMAGQAWRRPSVIVVGFVCLLYSLSNLYYYMSISLNYKAYVLLATGLGMLMLAVLGGRWRIFAISAANKRYRQPVPLIRNGVLVSLVAVLLLANTLIYQKEQVLRQGQAMVLELAPVDPRSLMQGDYMALHFALIDQVQAMLRDMPQEQEDRLRQQDSINIMLTPNEQGVFGLRAIELADEQTPYFAPDARYQDRENWPESALVLRLQRHGHTWSVGTDAWFFPEGRAHDFDAARYGYFKVGPSGTAILTEMLDQQLQVIDRLLPAEE